MDYVTNFRDDINLNMTNAVLCAKSTIFKESALYHILVCFVPTRRHLDHTTGTNGYATASASDAENMAASVLMMRCTVLFGCFFMFRKN